MTGALTPGVALAFAAALLVTAILAPCCARLGLVAQPDPHVASHTHAVPLGGGIAVLAGLAAPLAVACVRDPSWCGLAVALAIAGGLGAYKDLVGRDVSPAAQLAVQALAGLALVASGWRWTALPLALLLANAWNFLDVMDGLASGVGAIAFGAIALRTGALPAAALAGGCAGFLRRNWPPARQYLGDAGSFALGITGAALASRYGGLFAMAVPLLDLAQTCARRLVAGRSPFRGGPEHLALVLQARGWSRPRVLLLAYAAALATSAT